MDFAALHVDEITFPIAAAEKNVNKKIVSKLLILHMYDFHVSKL